VSTVDHEPNCEALVVEEFVTEGGRGITSEVVGKGLDVLGLEEEAVSCTLAAPEAESSLVVNELGRDTGVDKLPVGDRPKTNEVVSNLVVAAPKEL
jgi:hypothetical protein